MRTIYKHFTDKAGLCSAAVEDSAIAVSTTHIDRIHAILGVSLRTVAYVSGPGEP